MLLNMLAERGVDNDFCQWLLDYSTSLEQQHYIKFLEDLQGFVKLQWTCKLVTTAFFLTSMKPLATAGSILLFVCFFRGRLHSAGLLVNISIWGYIKSKWIIELFYNNCEWFLVCSLVESYGYNGSDKIRLWKWFMDMIHQDSAAKHIAILLETL